MRKPEKMPKNTWALVKEYFDKIYETDHFMDFWEVKGTYCGDIRCMRFYENGMVTER